MSTERDEGTAISTCEGIVHGYRVVYDEMPSNWAAYTPDLPVILVTGKSREDCESQMAELIPGHLAFLEQDAKERPWLYEKPRRHRR